MKVLFDTNVIVAALVEDHEMYARCQPWLTQVQTDEIEGFISTHSLAESYSILTRLPLTRKISPSTVDRLLTRNLARFVAVNLTVEDYRSALQAVIRLGITGGSIYDALIAQAALKTKVDSLLTFNVKHFIRLGEDVAQLVQVP